MEIAEFKTGKTFVLGLQGRLDGSSAPEFENKLFSLIDGGELTILIDCTNLVYISSAGLRVIFRAIPKLKEQSGKLYFCSLNSNVKKVFDLVNLGAELSIYGSQVDALKDINKEGSEGDS